MLRKLFALTEQGAKDLKKGIIASVFTLSLIHIWTASRTNTPWFNSRIRLDMRYAVCRSWVISR